MKRFLINSGWILLLVFTTLPVFATETNYDSPGTTTFYGEYEYPEESPKKDPEIKTDGVQERILGEKIQQSTLVEAELARKLPNYKGEQDIIPVTGDTTNLLPSLFGLLLLSVFFYKLKEVGNA